MITKIVVAFCFIILLKHSIAVPLRTPASSAVGSLQANQPTAGHAEEVDDPEARREQDKFSAKFVPSSRICRRELKVGLIEWLRILL